MAHRTALSEERPTKTPKAAKKPAGGTLANAVGSPKAAGNEERERVFDAFRRWGYLEAPLDPLGLFETLKHPDLEALAGEAAEEAVVSTAIPSAPISCICRSRSVAAGLPSGSKLLQAK